MSEEAKGILRDKIERFQVRRAITANIAEQFQLDLDIAFAKDQLKALESTSPTVTPAAPTLSIAIEANPAAATLFVGREAELKQMKSALLGSNTRPVALVGMPGVGKSYLADRFAHLHKTEFPGGVYRLVLDPEMPPATVEPLLAELATRLKVPLGSPMDVQRLRERLLAPRTLIHVENADGTESGRVAVDLVRLLPGCALVVSARLQILGTAAGAGWERVKILLLSHAEAIEQLEGELSTQCDHITLSERERLVRGMAFLPLAIHLAAGYLLAGLSVKDFFEELRAYAYDLDPVDPADPMIAAREGRVLLASSWHISIRLLARELGPDRAHLMEGFKKIGTVPVIGRNSSTTLKLPRRDIEILARKAAHLSLLIPVENKSNSWRTHPLLAAVLREWTAMRDKESAPDVKG